MGSFALNYIPSRASDDPDHFLFCYMQGKYGFFIFPVVVNALFQPDHSFVVLNIAQPNNYVFDMPILFKYKIKTYEI